MFIFGNLIFSVAVFLSALTSIFGSIIPFIFATVLIVNAFAHAFWHLGPPKSSDGEYLVNCGNMTDTDYENGGWMCTLKDSYFHCYSMVLSQDWSFLERATGVHSVFMFLFAFAIGILLLNIIIAIISTKFTEVEQNGERAFWLKRLRFVNEMQSFNSLYGKLWKGLNNEIDGDNEASGERRNTTPKWYKKTIEFLFFGDIEAVPLSSGNDDKNGKSKDVSYQKELKEIKEELKMTQKQLVESIQKQHAENQSQLTENQSQLAENQSQLAESIQKQLAENQSQLAESIQKQLAELIKN